MIRTPIHRLATLQYCCVLLALMSASCVTEVSDDDLSNKFQDLYAVTETNIVWRSVALETRRFSEIVLEPLRYRNQHINWLRVVSPAARARNSKAYEAAMRSILTPTFPLVEDDRPGSLRVEAWITDTVTAEKLLPVARRYNRVLNETDRLPEVGMEVKFYAGESREPVAVFLSTAPSARIQSNLRNPVAESVLMQAYEPFAQRLKNALTFRSWRAFD